MTTTTPERGTPGHLLQLIRRGDARTRNDLVDSTGLARSTVASRIDQLLQEGLITEIGDAPSTGGRPPTMLGFNNNSGVVLVADLGATHARLAISDLSGTPLLDHSIDLDIAAGPEPILDYVETQFVEMLELSGSSPSDVRGVGIGVPGPVEFAAGRAVNPPIMPGWNNYPIRDRFTARYNVPVLVDNDVNIMAVGEHWVRQVSLGSYPAGGSTNHSRGGSGRTATPPDGNLLFIKVGTGIGSGLILGDRIHRGTQGAAGDIGHAQIGPAEGVMCRCGNEGCLEAIAGGGALARRLSDQGLDVATSRDVVKLVASGEPAAIQIVREAGRLIGRVLATMVNILNPDIIVVGGDLSGAGEHLIAGIREIVYRRSTALATSRLEVVPTSLGDRAGITGAAAMVIEHILDPDTVDAALATALTLDRV